MQVENGLTSSELRTLYPLGFGCSDFQIKPADGSYICGRAMDFPLPMDSHLIIYNRESRFCSTAPDGSAGLEWTSKYGFVAINAFGLPDADEGMNEKGLSCGFLTLPETQYPTVPPHEQGLALAMIDVGNWILGNFATIAEVKEGLSSVRIWGNFVAQMGSVPLVHIALHDSCGENLVVEFIRGKIKLYDNPVGVLTNEPRFKFHIHDLKRYNALSPSTPSNTTINGHSIVSYIETGMLGIPGDWSSTSRFIRIAEIIRYLTLPLTALQGVIAAKSILNSVNLPPGAVTAPFMGKTATATTLWSSIKDLTNKIFYYSTSDGAIRSVRLPEMDFSPGSIHTTLPVQTSIPFILDVTQQLSSSPNTPIS